MNQTSEHQRKSEKSLPYTQSNVNKIKPLQIHVLDRIKLSMAVVPHFRTQQKHLKWKSEN